MIEYLGNEQLVHLVRNGTSLLAKVPVEVRVERGDEVEATVPEQHLHRFDAETGERR